MLNITNCQRNANQNYDEASFTSVRMAITKNLQTINARKKGTLLLCWCECKFVQPLRRTACRFLKKLKIQLPYDPANPLLSIYPEKMKTLFQKDTHTQCSQQHCLQQLRHESKLNVHQQLHGLKRCGTYVYNGILLSHKKE